MIELKDVVVVTKPIEGVYGARLNIQGTKEKQLEFNRVCKDIKEDVGLMQSNETTYEFLHQNKESVQTIAFQIAEALRVPALFL